MGFLKKITKAVTSNPIKALATVLNPTVIGGSLLAKKGIDSAMGGGKGSSDVEATTIDQSPLGKFETAGNQANKDRLAAVALRQKDIENFSASLTQARQGFLARNNALQMSAFKRFAPELEAQFASRGLSVTGGAYQSELAKQSAQLQSEQDAALSEQERQDILAQEQARAGFFPSQVGAIDSNMGFQQALATARMGANMGQATLNNQANITNANNEAAGQQAKGAFVGSLINTGLSFGLPALMGPAGAVAAPLASQALFPQGQAAPRGTLSTALANRRYGSNLNLGY